MRETGVRLHAGQVAAALHSPIHGRRMGSQYGEDRHEGDQEEAAIRSCRANAQRPHPTRLRRPTFSRRDGRRSAPHRSGLGEHSLLPLRGRRGPFRQKGSDEGDWREALRRASPAALHSPIHGRRMGSPYGEDRMKAIKKKPRSGRAEPTPNALIRPDCVGPPSPVETGEGARRNRSGLGEHPFSRFAGEGGPFRHERDRMRGDWREARCRASAAAIASPVYGRSWPRKARSDEAIPQKPDRSPAGHMHDLVPAQIQVMTHTPSKYFEDAKTSLQIRPK